MPLKVRPLSDRIIVQPDTLNDRTESGLHLPGHQAEAPQTGTVLQVGPGKYADQPIVTQSKTPSFAGTSTGVQLQTHWARRPMTVKPGDRVLFGKYGGVEIIVGREKILTLRQDDIIAILVEEADPL